jgi:CBS domain-containing protein
MTRRDAHYDAMLRHLGTTYYQTLQGQATATDVARALDRLEREEAHQAAAQEAARPRAAHRTGRWRVRDVMTTEVISVDKRTPGAQIARLLKEHHIIAVPVVTGGRRVAGVVSEADLLRTQRPSGKRHGLLSRRAGLGTSGHHTAGDLMTSPATTIHPDAPLGVAARRMTDHHLTLLPVVDADGELIGVVSRRDLLRVFLRPDEDIAAEISQVLTDVLLIDPASVKVSAHDGLVTLTGQVERDDLVAIAGRLAGDVDGVMAVVDNLTAPGVAAAAGDG